MYTSEGGPSLCVERYPLSEESWQSAETSVQFAEYFMRKLFSTLAIGHPGTRARTMPASNGDNDE